MKRVLIVAFSLFTLLASAQWEYHPFVKEGKVWNMWGEMPVKEIDSSVRFEHSFQYLMQGDTLIGTKIFKKVHLIDSVVFHNDSLHYIGAVREDGHKVYMQYPDRSNLVLLYDFDMEVGTIHMFDNVDGISIKQTKTVLLNSRLHHAQIAYYYYPPETFDAISRITLCYDGIGSVTDMDPFRYESLFWRGNIVMSCYEDGLCLYLRGEDYGDPIDAAYHTLLKQGRTWTRTTETEEADGDGNVTIKGDTIIDCQPVNSYKKVYQKVYLKSSKLYGDNQYHYYGAMREENKKVVFIQPGDGYEQVKLLFDFSLNVGEVVETTEGKAKVISIDSVCSAGRRYRQLTVKSNTTGTIAQWTEGIGGDMGILRSFPTEEKEDAPLYVYDGEECIYSYANVTSIADNIHSLSCSYQPSPIFDLQGRRLSEKPKRGMYIQNGKKYVVK